MATAKKNVQKRVPLVATDVDQMKTIEAKFEKLFQLQKEEAELKEKVQKLQETLKAPKKELGGEIGRRAILPKINPENPSLDLEVKKIPQWQQRAPPLELAWKAIDIVLGKEAVDKVQDKIKRDRAEKIALIDVQQCVTLQTKDLNKITQKRSYERNSTKNPNFIRYTKRKKPTNG